MYEYILYLPIHNTYIMHLKFLPESCDLKVVSCAGDGVIVYTDLDTKQADIVHSNAGKASFFIHLYLLLIIIFIYL